MNQEKRDYCLNCIKKPCQLNGCPIQNRIPEFIKEKDEKKAYEIITSTTLLGAICGRICPFSNQCEGVCTRGKIGKPVDIGYIEAEICDNAIKNGLKISKNINTKFKGKSVAIIGGGSSGLECAGFLAREGINVTIYEKHSKLGGILTHGIPEFRLKSEVIEKSINQILELGINVKYNQILGENLKIKQLQEKYDAIYLSIGANEPNITLKGKNIYSANGLLEYKNFPDLKNKKVIVNGGGNVAMDVARIIKHLGADVTIIYRRSENEMLASKEEIEQTKLDNVKIEYLTNILEYNKNIAKCIKTELIGTKNNDDTRKIPKNIPNTEYEIIADYVILATGSLPNIKQIQEFDKNEKGYIKVNEKYQTSIYKVFAGGDIIGTRSTVAYAVSDGLKASKSIKEYISK